MTYNLEKKCMSIIFLSSVYSLRLRNNCFEIVYQFPTLFYFSLLAIALMNLTEEINIKAVVTLASETRRL
jgi:hypothetical protein